MYLRQQEKLQELQIICPYVRLDSSNANIFRSEVIGTIAGNPVSVTVDLCNVIYMDSSGLGCLLGILRSVRANNGNLTVCSPSEQVRFLFELTAVDQILMNQAVTLS
jgi:anti-sigma B factor antagonist